MPALDEVSSSPLRPGTTLEETLKFYKAQYETLETELADFQASSKDLEAELEKDIEAAEKRERQLKDRAKNLQYEVDEWKEKHKQAKTEAGGAQTRLQKEITELRSANRALELKLRDIEVANDDYERQQRNTESSLEDMEAKYNQAFERAVMLEQEVQTGEQERESLRIDHQRLKDEFQDFKIEAEIMKERLKKAEEDLERRSARLSIDPTIQSSFSPRSELSPTTTNASSPSFDTPPAKTASSSGLSEQHTPPSPPTSEQSTVSRAMATPSVIKPRPPVSATPTPRQSLYSRPAANGQRKTSIGATTGPVLSRSHQPSSAFRQSLSRTTGPRTSSIPTSSSIMQLRNLRGKMQSLEQRVQKARSKLPGPVNTPDRASPRPGSAFSQTDNSIPTSVTVRNKKRTLGVDENGTMSVSGSDMPSTPSISRRASRSTLTQPNPGISPNRSMLPPRPASQQSGTSSRQSGFIPSHSRPGSRASISNLRGHGALGSGIGSKFPPNASTERYSRPQSALSSYDGHRDVDADMGEESLIEDANEGTNYATPTPRRSVVGLRPRTSEVGSSIPSPSKRTSIGTSATRLPAPMKRQSYSQLHGRSESRTGTVGTAAERPPSRATDDAKEKNGKYDINETF